MEDGWSSRHNGNAKPVLSGDPRKRSPHCRSPEVSSAGPVMPGTGGTITGCEAKKAPSSLRGRPFQGPQRSEGRASRVSRRTSGLLLRLRQQRKDGQEWQWLPPLLSPPSPLLPPNTRLCCSQGTGLSPGPRSLIVGLGDRPLSIWGKERKKATENLLHCRNSAEHFILP